MANQVPSCFKNADGQDDQQIRLVGNVEQFLSKPHEGPCKGHIASQRE